MTDSGTPRTKRCLSCGGDYLLAFFHRANNRINRSTNAAEFYRDRCMGCEASSRREEQMNQRLRRKAKETRRRHGSRLKELGVIKDHGDLEEVYGWSLERMVEDIKHVIAEGCSYCLQPVSIAEHGLGVVTLDILNPQHQPHYSTNIQWCCARCNSEKQRTSPDVWGARRSMWRLWRLNQDRAEADPEAYGFLPLNSKADRSPMLW